MSRIPSGAGIKIPAPLSNAAGFLTQFSTSLRICDVSYFTGTESCKNCKPSWGSPRTGSSANGCSTLGPRRVPRHNWYSMVKTLSSANDYSQAAESDEQIMLGFALKEMPLTFFRVAERRHAASQRSLPIPSSQALRGRGKPFMFVSIFWKNKI